MGLVQVKASLDEPLVAWLDGLAAAEGRSRSQMLRVLLERMRGGRPAAVVDGPGRRHSFRQAGRPAATGQCSCGEHRDAEVHSGF